MRNIIEETPLRHEPLTFNTQDCIRGILTERKTHPLASVSTSDVDTSPFEMAVYTRDAYFLTDYLGFMSIIGVNLRINDKLETLANQASVPDFDKEIARRMQVMISLGGRIVDHLESNNITPVSWSREALIKSEEVGANLYRFSIDVQIEQRGWDIFGERGKYYFICSNEYGTIDRYKLPNLDDQERNFWRKIISDYHQAKGVKNRLDAAQYYLNLHELIPADTNYSPVFKQVLLDELPNFDQVELVVKQIASIRQKNEIRNSFHIYYNRLSSFGQPLPDESGRIYMVNYLKHMAACQGVSIEEREAFELAYSKYASLFKHVREWWDIIDKSRIDQSKLLADPFAYTPSGEYLDTFKEVNSSEWLQFAKDSCITAAEQEWMSRKKLQLSRSTNGDIAYNVLFHLWQAIKQGQVEPISKETWLLFEIFSPLGITREDLSGLVELFSRPDSE